MTKVIHVACCNFAMGGVENKTWFSFGMMLVDVPSTCVLKNYSVTVFPSPSDQHFGESIDFWKQHQNVLELIDKSQKKSSRETAEHEIAEQIKSLKRDYPRVFFIANESRDIRVLDSILTSKGHKPISFRRPGLYLRSLDLFSYTSGVASLIPDIKAYSRAKSNLLGYYGPPHYPIAQCARAISRFIAIRQYTQVEHKDNPDFSQ